MKDSPVIWNVPSNENPVDPFENPHWSSKFGDVKVQDFAVQISTTKKFDNTIAHWWVQAFTSITCHIIQSKVYTIPFTIFSDLAFVLRSYRLQKNRALGNLFGIGNGGCTDYHSGIGDVKYVKDILTGTIVTTKFNCSQFGPDVLRGWVNITINKFLIE